MCDSFEGVFFWKKSEKVFLNFWLSVKFFGVPSKIVGFVTASFFVLMQIYLSFFLFKTN